MAQQHSTPQTIHRGSISQPTEPCRGPLQTQCSGSCGSKQRDKTCICSEHIRSTSSTQEQSRAHALRMELPYGLCPIPSAVPISQGSDVTAVQFNFFQPSLPNTILALQEQQHQLRCSWEHRALTNHLGSLSADSSTLPSWGN